MGRQPYSIVQTILYVINLVATINVRIRLKKNASFQTIDPSIPTASDN